MKTFLMAFLFSALACAAPQPQGDLALENQIAFVLTSDPTLINMRIAAKVRQGVVTLDGAVASAWEKQRAEELVSRVPGVASVENNLISDPLHALGDSDAAIAARIRAKWLDDRRVIEPALSVDVRQGVATLYGTAYGRDAAKAAILDAQAAGAKKIVNQLKLGRGALAE